MKWVAHRVVVGRSHVKFRNHPNLAKRPAKPAQNRGRIQREIRVAFVMLGKSTLTTAELAEFTHGHLMLFGEKLSPDHYRHIHRACLQIGAVPVGRAGGRGRPKIWRLNIDHASSKK
jgi:hypothetical protein